MVIKLRTLNEKQYVGGLVKSLVAGCYDKMGCCNNDYHGSIGFSDSFLFLIVNGWVFKIRSVKKAFLSQLWK